MNKLTLMEVLSRVPLFKDIPAPERQKIFEMKAIFSKIKAGTTFIKEGAQEPWFYIILAGEAQVTHRKHTVGQLHSGQFIGEVGFICREHRSASVSAVEDMVVMKIDYEAFRQLPVVIRDAIKDKIIAGLVERITKQNSNTVTADDERDELLARITELEAELKDLKASQNGG